MSNLRHKGFLIERRTVYSIYRPNPAPLVEMDGAAPLSLALPLLQLASDASKQGLQDLWARLLDAAMSFDRELARLLEDRS